MKKSDIKILVVDDEDSIRINVEAYLEDEGYNVSSAGSGEDAISKVESEDYHIGIIDMRLPGIDGNEVIINAHRIQPAMKFIIHTGSTGYMIPPSLKEIGITEQLILRKPLSDISIMSELIMDLV